jgi:pimeloyl-ACP methyl ester carboxylesterase
MGTSKNKPLASALSDSARLGWSIAREVGASVLTYELYPLGLWGERLPTVPNPWPIQRHDHVPILFIHGIFHNRSAFAWLKTRLAWEGWPHFKEINLSTSRHTVAEMAEQTAFHVQSLRARCQVPQIDIVAHSMGGIIARYYIQMLGGDGKVRHLITLGTPHRGTLLSQYSRLPYFRELSPESQTIQRLNQRTLPRLTQGLAISGNLDIFMQPRDCSWWEGMRNIELSNVGHAGLLFSRRVAQILMGRLQPQPQKEGANRLP